MAINPYREQESFARASRTAGSLFLIRKLGEDMKSRITGILVVSLVLLVVASLNVRAGQIASHIYTAQKSRIHLSPECQALVAANLEAYLAGAQGPDIIGVVQHGLSKLSTMPVQTVGEEAHYLQTGELALNLLYTARKPAEKAFALGWITHYLNDIYVHTLVNEYGGYYKVAADHHKTLEQLESKYLYETKSGIVTEALALSTPADLGPDFAHFIIEAYHRTFPANPLYVANDIVGMVEGVGTKTRGDHFCEQFRRASTWCLAAGTDFYQAHIGGSGVHDNTQYYVAGFPNMPTQKQYEKLIKPLEWTVALDANELVVEVTVNDNKLYGRFLKEWEIAAQNAIDHAGRVLPTACAYLDEKDHAKQKTLRATLAPLVPNRNLDNPDPSYTVSTANPGNVNLDQVIFEMIPLSDPFPDRHFPAFTQKWGIQFTDEEGFDGARIGKVTMRYNMKDYTGDFVFRAKLAEDAKFKGYDYLEYDSRFEGGDRLGRVRLGEPFEVTFPYPSRLAGKKGVRKYILLPGKEGISEEDLMVIEWGFEAEKFRYDVAVLDEQVDSKAVHATLQVTNLNRRELMGPAQVAMVWLTKDGGDKDLSGMLEGAMAEMDEAMEAMDAIDEALDLTEEQEAELEAKMEAYEAELRKKGNLSEEEIEDAMAAHAMELMTGMNKDMEAILGANAAVKKMETEDQGPYHATKRLILEPVTLRVDDPPGWKRGVYGKEMPMSASFTKTEIRKRSVGHLDYSIEGRFNVSFLNDQDLIKEFRERIGAKAGWNLTVDGYKGDLFKEVEEDETHWKADNSNLAEGQEPNLASRDKLTWDGSGEALLERGAVAMWVSFGFQIVGNRATDKKGKVICDGLVEARRGVKTIEAEIMGMLKGAKVGK